MARMTDFRASKRLNEANKHVNDGFHVWKFVTDKRGRRAIPLPALNFRGSIRRKILEG